MHKQNKAVLLALLAVLFWSTVAVAFKTGLKSFHYVHFLFISIAISVMVAFFTLLFQKKMHLLAGIGKRDLLIGVFGGMLNPFLYYLMLFKAYSILPAQIAQALNYTWPIVLVLMSVPFLGQKLNLKGFATLLVGFAGVYLIAAQGQPWPLQPAEPFGVILAISTSVIWAGFWIINTKSAVDPVVNLFLNFSTGFLLTLPLALMIPWDYQITPLAWAAVLYSGFFEMGITFVIWLTAMKLTERTDKISNYVFLSPFISLFFIRLVLKEHIYLTTLIGLVLIVSSIFLNRWVNKKALK